jgi:hypothetical protein
MIAYFISPLCFVGGIGGEIKQIIYGRTFTKYIMDKTVGGN